MIPQTCPRWCPRHAADMPQMMPQTCPRHVQMMNQTCPSWCPRHAPDDIPDIFYILRAPAVQKYNTWWVFSALYLALPGCTWLYLALPDFARLYLAVPGSALVCHDLPFQRLPRTATDWPNCFSIYRLKCSKDISGWDGRMEISVSTCSKSTALRCL